MFLIILCCTDFFKNIKLFYFSRIGNYVEFLPWNNSLDLNINRRTIINHHKRIFLLRTNGTSPKKKFECLLNMYTSNLLRYTYFRSQLNMGFLIHINFNRNVHRTFPLKKSSHKIINTFREGKNKIIIYYCVFHILLFSILS